MTGVGNGLAGNLRAARRERGLTQETLATVAGTSKSYIATLESGKVTNPGVYSLYALALGLGMRLEDLMGVSLLENSTKARVRKHAESES